MPLICPTAPAECFYVEDWTGQISLIRLDKSVFCGNATTLRSYGRARSNLVRQRIGN
jgi:hypothetical protein